ncbi:ribosome-associated translation inhibitor RaiA [bacterium]|nr:MAG: ribosome-associated translation inhibitor RaiA [bacterium]
MPRLRRFCCCIAASSPPLRGYRRSSVASVQRDIVSLPLGSCCRQCRRASSTTPSATFWEASAAACGSVGARAQRGPRHVRELSSMQVIVKGKNVKVTPAMRAYAEQKIGHLAHYFDRVLDASVSMSIERNWQIVDASIAVPGETFSAADRTQDMYASVDAVVDKLTAQITKFKERRTKRGHESIREGAAPVSEEEEPQAPQVGRITRRKRFGVRPMAPEDAAEEMKDLGHDFFIFVNAQSEQFSVLYRRRDGSLGLIEPYLE